jgi:hypothetical protein
MQIKGNHFFCLQRQKEGKYINTWHKKCQNSTIYKTPKQTKTNINATNPPKSNNIPNKNAALHR